ncbi:MAG: hypothetical protein ACOC8D_00570 [bacterium]
MHLPGLAVCLLAAVLVAAWVGLHALKRRVRASWLRGALFPARVGVGFLALLAVMDAVQRVLVFATNWPLWPLALLGAVGVEVLLVLYGLERRIVPRRTGLALAALRVALVLAVIAMLSQPVRSVETSRTLQRFVAVLLDTSASMAVPDKQMTPAERIRLAEALSPEAPQRPYRFEAIQATLRDVRQEVTAQIDWLASLRELEPEARLRQLEGRRRDSTDALQGLADRLTEQIKAVAEPLHGKLPLGERARTSLGNLRDAIDRQARQRLLKACNLLTRKNLPSLAREPQPLLDVLRRAAGALGDIEPKLAAAGAALDEALYHAQPAEARAAIDAAATRDRQTLARQLLDGHPDLLGRLQDDYGVRLYTFHTEAAEVDLDAWRAGKTADNGGDTPSEEDAGPQGTDLAAALEKVITEMPAERLAGMLLLTDGQHNAPRSVEPLARRIGLQDVPISSVVFGGGEKPTIDAAVVSLEAPDTVYARDQMYLDAELKLDGLAGKTVDVVLYDGEEIVDVRRVEVKSETFRTRLQLADGPRETGLHAYRVAIAETEGEVLATNNEHPLSVNVSDDQTRLLVVEGRPRWEFRYLKNLFASRDRTVRLQYVLLEPDLIPGQDPRPTIHAAAARAKEDPEATAPPEDEGEWMKFDVIVLGDVEPSALPEKDLEAVRKFVVERGGTLIVVAGPRYMPHAYADTPLGDILPATFEKIDEPDAYLPAPDEEFTVALTPEGRASVITRLRVDPDENLETWKALPRLHWRHPLTRAKQGATVLAYAMPATPPDFMAPVEGTRVPAEETLEKRRAFVRDNALIALHNAALGQVLFFSFDRTWRLRYRVGDTLHHKLWGQVLRWATADKLPEGTSYVKVGTTRPRYGPHEPVQVRAKLVQPDYTPVTDAEATALIYRGDKLVLRKKLDYVPNSLGIYSATLGQLPGGTYRYELEAPAAEKLLAAEGVDKVSTEFFVESAIPVEQVELAADRGLLEGLARLTGGRVAEPHRAEDALAALGQGVLKHRERRQWALWDSWPLLVLIVVLAGAEWFLRKRVRLP